VAEHGGDLAITHGDLRGVPGFDDATLIAVRAPPGTDLEVPDPDAGRGGARRFELQLRSRDLPVEVFLVDRAEGPPRAAPEEPPTPDKEVAAASAAAPEVDAEIASATAAVQAPSKRHRSQTPPNGVPPPSRRASSARTPPAFCTPRILSKATPTADQLDKDFVFNFDAGEIPIIPSIPSNEP